MPPSRNATKTPHIDEPSRVSANHRRIVVVFFFAPEAAWGCWTQLVSLVVASVLARMFILAAWRPQSSGFLPKMMLLESWITWKVRVFYPMVRSTHFGRLCAFRCGRVRRGARSFTGAPPTRSGLERCSNSDLCASVVVALWSARGGHSSTGGFVFTYAEEMYALEWYEVHHVILACICFYPTGFRVELCLVLFVKVNSLTQLKCRTRSNMP